MGNPANPIIGRVGGNSVDRPNVGAHAKRLMREEFKAAENAELFDWGKELDEKYYRPQIEAEKAERAAPQEPERRQQSPGRSRPGPQ